MKDVENVKSSVNDFIKKYNDTIQFLRANGRLDPDTKVRGVLANDSLYSGLVESRMQQITTKIYPARHHLFINHYLALE